jgi:hypothetical protein
VTDALGRVTSETSVLGTFGYGYVGATGRSQTIHHKQRNQATLSKFDASTMLGVALSLPKGDYTYDVVGNILMWQQQADDSQPTIWRYGYDRANQR